MVNDEIMKAIMSRRRRNNRSNLNHAAAQEKYHSVALIPRMRSYVAAASKLSRGIANRSILKAEANTEEISARRGDKINR